MARKLLILPSIFFFAWLGIMALLYPAGLLGGYGITVPGIDGFNEIRAVYGGIPLGFAAILSAGLIRPRLRSGICLTVAAAAFGMAAGRILSAAIDQSLGTYPLIFMLVEMTVGATLIAAIFPRKSEMAAEIRIGAA
ncbi:MAG: DUF4345 family protein [Sphingomonadaceae bacterium]